MKLAGEGKKIPANMREIEAILGGKVTTTQFYWGMAGGIIGVAGWNFVLNSPFGIDGLIIGVMGNALLFTLGKLFATKDSPVT